MAEMMHSEWKELFYIADGILELAGANKENATFDLSGDNVELNFLSGKFTLTIVFKLNERKEQSHD